MKRNLLAALAGITLLITWPAQARPSGRAKPERPTTITSGERTSPRARKTPSAQQQANVSTLQQDLSQLKSGSEVTQAQKDQLASDLRVLAEGTTKPSQASVQKLASDLSHAVADGNLSRQEQAALTQDVAAVMNSANIPPAEVEAALASAESILKSSNIDQQDAQVILADLEAIARELQSQASK